MLPLVTVTVMIIVLQVHSSGNSDIVDTFTGSHLVELSIVTAHCHDQIQDDIKNFADQLKPYPLAVYHIVSRYITARFVNDTSKKSIALILILVSKVSPIVVAIPIPI